ncbi:Transcriptional regulator, IclR family (fragment) [Paraburkholderia piptadeniae]|uniref:Transcriptional regulator, IclR family n=1 Tax=Paraburkholderia piptadeniae TaxID=1701573 RepID=A0A1N7RVH0_9BURK
MRVLADLTKETVHLSDLDAAHVVYVNQIESLQPVRVHSILGTHVPAYCMATGKILLAYQSEDYLERHLTNLVAYTRSTITDFAELKAQLARAALNGYAINRGEWEEGGGIAAPIFDAFRSPVAAIGISGPLERLTVKRMKELTSRVLDETKGILRVLCAR